MAKKILIILISTLISLFLFTACSTTKVEDTGKDLKKVTVLPTKGLNGCESYEEAGKIMVDSVVNGLSTGNYDLYCRDFTDANKKYFNDKVFSQAVEAVKKDLGEFQSKSYVGFWVKGDYTIMLWKARYSKTNDDILIEMYVAKTEDKSYKIAALVIK